MTSRGNWYLSSWKGELAKSGGVATNIGVHFFDMLLWIFGAVKSVNVNSVDDYHASGYLELERARVKWFLSINYNHIPEAVRASGKRTYRSLTMEGTEIEFSEGFTDLHTKSYEEVLKGKGFGLTEARPSIDLTHTIRSMIPKT
jgi:UDP-N-acetyl-2-amino-2-deoxyglucuronate dehydrogenase